MGSWIGGVNVRHHRMHFAVIAAVLCGFWCRSVGRIGTSMAQSERVPDLMQHRGPGMAAGPGEERKRAVIHREAGFAGLDVDRRFDMAPQFGAAESAGAFNAEKLVDAEAPESSKPRLMIIPVEGSGSVGPPG